MKSIQNMLRGGSALSALAIIGAGAFAAAPAMAQDQAAASANADIVVTGSRIARPDLTSNSPTTIVSSELIAQSGRKNIEDVLNQLPQVAPGLNSNVNNGGDGTATVDLRGLGPSRTLVLINGRRLVPSTNTGRTDLNNIPSHLIERVDVVTGGASAVYGSDALAGVVNFILKRNFEGVELGGQYGVTERGDSDAYDIYGIFGANTADGRGNVTVHADYFQRQGSFQSERGWSKIDLQGNGSSTGVAGRFDNNPLNAFPSASNYSFGTNGVPRPFVNKLPELNNGVGDRYNFAPVNYLQTPQKKFELNLLGHYDLGGNNEIYTEGLYINNRVTLQLAPTPATNIAVDPLSPALTPEARALLATRPNPTAPVILRRRMADVGPRIQDLEFNTYQITLGARGDIAPGWNYDFYYSYGRTDQTSSLTNDISKTRFIAGLNGCPVGSPTGCISLGNAFGGTLSSAQADYIRIGSSVDNFSFDRTNVVGAISGKIVDLPAGPLGVSIGGEYRRDSSSFKPSESSRLGDLGGFNAQSAISGNFNVKEVFGELNVPVLKDAPFAHYLGFEAGARYSDYSTVGGQWTYKIGGEYAPISGLRFRSMYQRATRAPSVFELYQAGDQNFPTVNDPCASKLANNNPQAISASTAAICRIQLNGLDVIANPITQSNSQVESRNVGNTNLGPEKSETFTVGAVLTPKMVPGLNLSVDYYSIKLENYIDRLAGGSAALVNACFASGVTTAAAYNSNAYCRYVSRNASGELFLTVPLANAGSLKTRGIDFAGSYSFTLFGPDNKFAVNANMTRLLAYDLDGTRYEGLSTADRGTLPKWRSNVRLSYTRGDLTAAVNWQRIGEVLDSGGSEGWVKSQNYFDLNVKYGLGKLTLYAGVINLFDKMPPMVLNGVTNSNTDNSMYDSLGRRFFTGASFKF